MLGGIRDLIMLFDGPFKETKFKDCINRTFIKTGTLPLHRESEDLPNTFVVYRNEEQNGTMSLVPMGTKWWSICQQYKMKRMIFMH